MNQKILKKVFIVLLFWAPVIAFMLIAGEVIRKKPLPFDMPILSFLHAHANESLDSFFFAITTLGSPTVMIILAVIIAAFLFFQKKRKDLALVIALGGAGAGIANVILKVLFHRHRPSVWHSVMTENGFSFPSGHAMLSAAVVAALVVVVWQTRSRWLTVFLGGLYVLLVGVSRLYFGVHYPSDILAGWCVSVAWVLLVSYLVNNHLRLSFK